MSEQVGNIEYAGFWRRFAAAIIDAILYYIIFYIVIFSLGYSLDSPELGLTSKIGILELLLLPIYIVIMHVSKWQATIGKRLMKIFVVEKCDLQKISYIRSFFREFCQWVCVLPLIAVVLSIPTLTDGQVDNFAEYEALSLEIENNLVECEESSSSDEKIDACYEESSDAIDQTMFVGIALVISFLVMFILMFFWYGIAGWTREKIGRAHV